MYAVKTLCTVGIFSVLQVFVSFSLVWRSCIIWTYRVALVQVVMEPRKIAVNYVKSWFVVDVIAAVPFDLVLYSTGTSDVSIKLTTLETYD